MRIEKRIKTQISTGDVDIIYSSNVDERLLGLLNDKYGGRCFKSCYIHNIARIVRRTPPIIDSYRCGGQASFDIEFVANATVYSIGEVIPRAEVVEITDNGTILMTAPGVEMGMRVKGMQYVKVGSIIPVIVKNIKYSPMLASAHVTAMPFVPVAFPDKQWTISVSQKDIASLQAFIQRNSPPRGGKDTDAKDAKDVEEKRKLLHRILATHKKTPTVPKEAKVVDLRELRPGTYCLYQPEWLEPWECISFPVKDSPLDGGDKVLRGFANNAIQRINLIDDLVSTYKFDASEKDMWNTYLSGRL